MVHLKMRCLRGLILLFIVCCAAFPLAAQHTVAVPSPTDYIFRNIDNGNGLNSNDVFSFAQDHRGYVWIGSAKGLQRYDGLRFVNFLNDGNAEGDLAITGLFTDDAQQRMLYTQNDFQLYERPFLQSTGTLMPISQMQPYRDSSNRPWQLQRFRDDMYFMQQNGRGAIHAAHAIHEGYNFWLVDQAFGLFLVDTVHHRLYTPDYNPLQNPLMAALHAPGTSIREMVPDRHGDLWMYSWSHLFYRYETATQTLHTYSLTDILHAEGNAGSVPGWISGILDDNHGNVWLATARTGLLRYDRDKDQFQYTQCVPNSSLSLQYNHQINTLFQDREENIWLGTDKGISIFNPYRTHFTRLHNQDVAMTQNNNSELCTMIQLHNGEIWVGSWGGGINMYDRNLHATRNLFFKDQYDYNLVWSLLEQPDGSIWAGCQQGALHKINPVTLAVETLHPPELGGSTIRCMVHDNHGNTLFGLHSGRVVVWDAGKKQFLPFVDNGKPLGAIENLYVDADNTCWVSSRKGLQAFDIQQRCFTGRYLPVAKQAVFCKGIDEYNDSTLIVGTDNAGLYFFNKHTHLFRKIPVNEDRPFAAALAVKKDSAGNIWFSGDYVISCYNPQQQRLSTYRPEKGLINDAFRATNFVITQDGMWFTWSDMEALGFRPAGISHQPSHGDKVNITGFSVYAQPLGIDSLLNTAAPVQLSYDENFIGIEFSDLQFAGTVQTKYYYRLDGVDKDWVSGGTRGYAGYTGLAPGNYLFHVKAGSHTPETTLAIRITAPFWARGWFRLLCGAVLLLAVAGLIRWYNHNVRQEASMKQQLAQTEMMALRAQMNPHFIFNCINSIDALIQTDDKYLATVSLNKFARLIRNILDSSQQHTTTLMHDLETLKLYIDLEQLRNEHPFTAEIKVDATLLEEDCKVPPLIIQPYVENAILHGLRNRRDDGGKLTITINRQNDRLVYVIQDNGVGRSAAQNRIHRHQSYGMEMSRSRVELFNGDENIPVMITDLEENGQPAGTRVEVSLKYC